MALFDNGLKIGTGVAIGLGVLLLVPAIAPGVATVVRPIAKASIKGGIMLFEKALEFIAEAKESVEDLAAEAHAELVQERQLASSQVSADPVENAAAD
jgi:hypothetical protein